MTRHERLNPHHQGACYDADKDEITVSLRYIHAELAAMFVLTAGVGNRLSSTILR